MSNHSLQGAFRLFRIISPDGDYLALSETVQGVVEIVKNDRPGRYQIDETNADLLSSGQPSRNWGAVIRFPSGDIAIHSLQGPV
jgi:Tol biopolymer transport system component